jgi:hypothetical protein
MSVETQDDKKPQSKTLCTQTLLRGESTEQADRRERTLIAEGSQTRQETHHAGETDAEPYRQQDLWDRQR